MSRAGGRVVVGWRKVVLSGCRRNVASGRLKKVALFVYRRMVALFEYRHMVAFFVYRSTFDMESQPVNCLCPIESIGPIECLLSFLLLSVCRLLSLEQSPAYRSTVYSTVVSGSIRFGYFPCRAPVWPPCMGLYQGA